VKVLLAVAALVHAGGIGVQTSLAPRPVLFGDDVTAHVDVLVDTRRVDPRSVRVTDGFGAWRQAAPERTTTTVAGGTAKRSFRFTLSCLDSTCLPHVTRFAPVTVTARLRDGRTITVRRRWPALTVVGRVAASAAAAAKPPFRAQTALPAPSFDASPTPLALWLDVLAGLLAAAGAAVVAAELVRRRRLLAAGADERPPLVRALALVREAERRAPADRRKAAGLLARTLAQEGGDGLADRAARVAWSSEQPSPERLDRLADDVEKEIE
jgi:hypothetical protein